MRRAFLFSLAFHFAVLLLAYFGLPATRSDQALLSETALSVELVDVAEKSNVPPARQEKKIEPEEKPKPREQARAPEPVDKERPAPPPAAPPPPAVKPEPPPPAVKPEPALPAVKAAPPAPPPKAEPEPAPKAEPEPAEVASFTPKAKAPAPEPEKPPAKPEPERKPEPKAEKKPEPKAEPKPTQPDRTPPKPEETEMDFAAVLRSVETAKQKAPAGELKKGDPTAPSGASPSPATSASFDASQPVTISEIDMVRRQIEQCWNLPAGARDAPDMRVSIVVDMNADGTPRGAVVEDQGRMQASPSYRVAAESALRAVLNPRCHPFKLPREKYERWKRMTLVFDPKEMLGS
jgi:outer membrane biosynthesis protein TonB